MQSGIHGREPKDGSWGVTMKGTLGDHQTDIDDKFRRMLIVRKAKRLFMMATIGTFTLFIGMSAALFFVGPLIRPLPEADACPTNEETGQTCSGHGACPGVNGTVCLCPIYWEGPACEAFAVGIVVFALLVLSLILSTMNNCWKLFGPKRYDGSEKRGNLNRRMKFGEME